MRAGKRDIRTIYVDGKEVVMVDQRKLPHKLVMHRCRSYKDTIKAIKDMVVRGAPAIGAAGAYAMMQFVLSDDYSPSRLKLANKEIASARPTARDLFHALDFMMSRLSKTKNLSEARSAAIKAADDYADMQVDACRKIGVFGNMLIKKNMRILTHCNAGALATVDFGTALAPIRIAQRDGKSPFVYVSETRPWLQGARLTAWELEQEGINHAVIADSASGYFMQQGKIDIVIVGADRIAANGDTANKIGTYEKAVLAKENNVPFYIAAPLSTFDMQIKDGKEIPIEMRPEDEVHNVHGRRMTPARSNALNPVFDITPAKYITGIITEKGIIVADEKKHQRIIFQKQAVVKHMTEEYAGTKFSTDILSKDAPRNGNIEILKKWGKRLYDEGMMPDHAKGGSGNMSFRTSRGFIISATGTRLGFLGDEDLVEVVNYDESTNTCKVIGAKEPSSESIMHHMVYNARQDVNAIFHSHDTLVMRNANRLNIAQTDKEMPYGTTEVAKAMVKTLGKHARAAILKGHGVVYVGKDMDEAGKLCMELHDLARNKNRC